LFATKFSDESLSDVKRRFQKAVELYETNVQACPPNVNTILAELETEASEPEFWEASNQARNAYITSQISQYSRVSSMLEEWEALKGDGETAMEMLFSEDADELFSTEEKEALLDELAVASQKLFDDGERYQLELLLSGPYDDQPCRILLTAGAGGTEATDWVADLRRMYDRKWDTPYLSKMNNQEKS
jgi:peptide chain release factor 2